MQRGELPSYEFLFSSPVPQVNDAPSSSDSDEVDAPLAPATEASAPSKAALPAAAFAVAPRLRMQLRVSTERYPTVALAESLALNPPSRKRPRAPAP
jgi:hypothetical protein